MALVVDLCLWLAAGEYNDSCLVGQRIGSSTSAKNAPKMCGKFPENGRAMQGLNVAKLVLATWHELNAGQLMGLV